MRIITAKQPIEGASDHRVSEAIYLTDPDGNGLELYVDRPRKDWFDDSGRLVMTTDHLDLHMLLEDASAEVGPLLPPETRLGHIHLSVISLSAAERFFHEELGLEVTQRSYPGALFFAADGYHHHVGANTWMHADRPADPKALGLVDFTFSLSQAATVETKLSPDGTKVHLAPFPMEMAVPL